MSIQEKYKLSILFILITLLIIIVFWGIWDTFFQQDEWLGLGQTYVLGPKIITNGVSPLGLLFGEGRPITRGLGVIITLYFPMKIWALAAYSLFFHAVNACLVFLISKKILKSDRLALLASIFFALSAVSHQNVTWFAASFGGLLGAFCIFLSIYLVLIYLEKKEKRFLASSFLVAFLSFYVKENGIFLFIFLPLTIFIYKKNLLFTKTTRRMFYLIVAIAVLFIVYRLFNLLPASVDVSKTAYADVGRLSIVPRLISRAVLYPLTGLTLVYLPQSLGNELGMNFLKINYSYITSRPDQIAQTVILDELSIIASFVLLFILYLISKEGKDRRNQIVFSLLLFGLSLSPYILVTKGYAYLEPRYYYVPMAANGIILSILVLRLFRLTKKISSAKYFITGALLLFILVHVLSIRKDIAVQLDFASTRRAYLADLNKLVPTLKENKNIFYITGDKPWLHESNFTPFQNNFGYSLMVIYYPSGKIPKEPMTKETLWIMGDWGAYEGEGKLFGYTYTFDQLKALVGKYNIPSSGIHALYYDYDKKQLTDISESTRKKLGY